MRLSEFFFGEMTKDVKNISWLVQNNDNWIGVFEVNNIKYEVKIENLDSILDLWLFKFSRNGSYAMINDFNQVGSIIFTIQNALTQFLMENHNYVAFTAKITDKGRIRVYDKRAADFPTYVKHEFYENGYKYYVFAKKNILDDVDKLKDLLIRNFVITD